MGYELYQSRHKGYEIDNLLDDVKDIKPKVAAMEQGYDANKVKMADGTVLPAFLIANMASKNDIADMATNTSVAKDIQDATKDFVDGDAVITMIATATAGFVDGNTVVTMIAAATKDFVTESDVEDIISDDFTNKSTLDDLATSDSGDLLFKGKEIKGRPEDGVFIDQNDIIDLGGGELIGNPDDFVKAGDYPDQIGLYTDKITALSHYGSSWAQASMKNPIRNNKQKLIITKSLKTIPASSRFFGYYLGTSRGASDIAAIRADISKNNTVDVIDLSKYTNKDIYFSIRIDVAVYDNVDATITSIMNGEHTEVAWTKDFNGKRFAPRTLLDYAMDSFGNPVEFTEPSEDESIVFKDGKWINKKIESGSDVEANPEGAATEELKKLRVGNGIFSIPEGGSGGVGGDLYFGMDDYSEEEKVVGRWKDGRPVYQKTYLSTLPATSKDGTYVEKVLDNIYSNEYNIIGWDGCFKLANNNGVYPLVYGTNALYFSKWYIDVKELKLANSCVAFSNANAKITIRYTKTTDSENSFKPSMMTNNTLLPVAPSYDDYSEDEICIGKWIDGRPLYRKIITTHYDCKSSGYQYLDILPTGIKIRRYEGSFYDGTIAINVYYDPNYYLFVDMDTNKVRVKASGWSTGDIMLIIEYTKTTDAENSFTPDMIKTIPLTDDVTEEEVNVAIDILKEAK